MCKGISPNCKPISLRKKIRLNMASDIMTKS